MATEEGSEAAPGTVEGAEAASGTVEGAEWVDVDSSAVSSVGFNEETGEITVVWHNGAESTFGGDRASFEALTGAPSVGKAVNAMMGRGG